MTDTLYYDGQCPLCDREVARLKALSGDALVLCDIHTVDDPNLPSKEILLQSLHLRTTQGDWVQGLDANVLAWQYTRFGFLIRWLRWPLIHVFSRRVYNCWAVRRYRRLYGLRTDEN